MNSPTIIALLGFIGWTLLLLVLMEVIRSKMVLLKEIAPNRFNPENSNLSPFMQRLARAHANCLEGMPIFAGLMIVAIISSNTQITDQLAYLFLAARISQSIVHLLSISSLAVIIRFSLFVVQLAIALYWFVKLLNGFL